MEVALEESKSNLSQQQQTDSQDLLNRLFHTNRPRTPQAVARVLREERWSVDQAIQVLKLLYEQQRTASGADTVVVTTTRQQQQQQSPQRNTTFQIANPNNVASSSSSLRAVNQTQLELVESYVQCLLEAAALLDEETLQAAGFSHSLLLSNNNNNRRSRLQQNNNNNNGTRNSRWSGRGEQALRSQWKAWQRTDEKELERLVTAAVQVAIKGSTIASSQNSNNNNNVTSSVEEYVRQTLGLGPANTNKTNNDEGLNQFNMSRGVIERVSLVPLWVPSPLIKFMVASRALLDSDDVKAIKERVLPASRFYCTSLDSIPSAALFRGNIRNNNIIVSSKPSSVADNNEPNGAEAKKEQTPLTAAVFAEIQELMDREQLSSRVQLLFMPDPEWRPNRDEREPIPKPVLLAIPKAVVPDESLLERQQQQSVLQSIGKKVAVGLTVLTTLTYSVSCYALNPKFFESVVNQQDIATVGAALPIFVGVCAVSAIHEIAHRLVARKRGMKIGWPIPLPSVQFGTFGCITPLRSFPPNRAALLDFALSGPVAALLVSVLLMVFGIHQTVHAAPMALQNFPVVPMALLKSSFLTSSLLTILAPKVMMLPLSQPIPIHPCFMVGFSGLIVSALNLLPIFRLDGGRACSAAMGPRFGGIASASTLLFLLSAALSGSSGVAWAFGVLILFFQRRPDIPVRDDATEVDDFRLGTWVASLLTSVLALAPFPGGPGLL